jgi:hypothetical protein
MNSYDDVPQEVKKKAQDIRKEFIRLKSLRLNKGNGKGYKPDARSNQPRNWIRAAILCLEFNMAADKFVALAFDRVGMLASGPLPTYLTGKAMRRALNSYKENHRGNSTRVTIHVSKNEQGEEERVETITSYDEFEEDLSNLLATAHNAVEHICNFKNITQKEVLLDDFYVIDVVGRCLLGWHYPEVREKFGADACVVANSRDASLIVAAEKMNITAYAEIINWNNKD